MDVVKSVVRSIPIVVQITDVMRVSVKKVVPMIAIAVDICAIQNPRRNATKNAILPKIAQQVLRAMHHINVFPSVPKTATVKMGICAFAKLAIRRTTEDLSTMSHVTEQLHALLDMSVSISVQVEVISYAEKNVLVHGTVQPMVKKVACLSKVLLVRRLKSALVIVDVATMLSVEIHTPAHTRHAVSAYLLGQVIENSTAHVLTTIHVKKICNVPT